MLQPTPLDLPVLTPARLEDFRLAVRLVAAAATDGVSVLGELLAHGLETFGEEKVRSVLSEEGLSRPLAENALAVARQPKTVRHFKIPIQFRLAVARAGLKPVDATKWLKIASERKMSIRDFARSLAAGRIVDSENDSGGSFELSLIENFSVNFNRWLSQAESQLPIAEWPKTRLASLREELRPMAELAARIDRMLTAER